MEVDTPRSVLSIVQNATPGTLHFEVEESMNVSLVLCDSHSGRPQFKVSSLFPYICVLA